MHFRDTFSWPQIPWFQILGSVVSIWWYPYEYFGGLLVGKVGGPSGGSFSGRIEKKPIRNHLLENEKWLSEQVEPWVPILNLLQSSLVITKKPE